jgi:hypothetical protein
LDAGGAFSMSADQVRALAMSRLNRQVSELVWSGGGMLSPAATAIVWGTTPVVPCHAARGLGRR